MMRIALTIALIASLAASAFGGEGAVRAFSSAGGKVWAVGDGALILRSDDGGKTWRSVSAGLTGWRGRADFTGVHFTDENVGYIFGGGVAPGHPGWATRGVILKTADGGKSLKPLKTPLMGFLHGGRIDEPAGGAFGLATRACPSGLWATISSGGLWGPVKTASAGPLLGGAFLNVRLAYLVGPANRIVSFRRLKEPPLRPKVISSPAALRGAVYIDKNTCWAVGENATVLISEPGQQVWRSRTLPLPEGGRRLIDLTAAAAANTKEVFLAGGLTGVIFRTRDGGTKFEPLAAPGPGPIHALTRLADGSLLAGGSGGRIWISSDDGANWKLAHGRENVDVLFVIGASDMSVYAALAAHAAAGCDTAVVFATVPRQPAAAPATPGPRGEAFLRAAAASAGAGGVTILKDFISVAGVGGADKLDSKGVIKHWSASLDVDAEAEMLRHLTAVIRMYRPAVVVTGPDGYEALGTVAENRLVARLTARAVELAADEAAEPALAKLSLPAHRVDRVFIGADNNDRFTAPWDKRPKRERRNAVVEFVGWRYPRGAGVSLSMSAFRSACLLPWVGPEGRTAEVTSYRCTEILTPRPLFTTGLTDARFPREIDPPMDNALASGATLRAATIMGRNLGVTVEPILKAARANPADPLPADLLYQLVGRLLAKGNLAGAADAQRELLSVSAAHPLSERMNVAAVAALASSEWLSQHRVYGLARRPTPKQFKVAVKKLARWHKWIDDEYGLMLLAKANAAAGGFERARAAYRDLARSGRKPWATAAKVELAALGNPLVAVAAADGLLVTATPASAKIDGRLKESFYAKAVEAPLAPSAFATAVAAAPPRAAVKMAATPTHLIIAIRMGGRPPAGRPDAPDPDKPDEARPLAWKLALAIDADRDVWTQLVLRCDSTAKKSLQLLTRLGQPAKLRTRLIPVEARSDANGWTIELALPRKLMGISSVRTELIRLQLALTITPPGGKPTTLYLAEPGRRELEPQRYRLLALPMATPDAPKQDPNRRPVRPDAPRSR